MDLPIISRARRHGGAPAVEDHEGTWSYGELLAASAGIAEQLLGAAADLAEARVGLAIPAGGLHVAAQWGIWRAGGVVVPLSQAATAAELEQFLADVRPACILATGAPRPEVVAAAGSLGIPIVHLARETLPAARGLVLPAIAAGRRAMILCTSGTTSRPKGVVSTHAGLSAQITSLIEAWRWSAADRIPLFLPLYHIHGIVNVMSSCLWAGGRLDAFSRFDAAAILDRVAAGRYTLFMAVPTIYGRLVEAIAGLPDDARQAAVAGFSALRLAVSGSAALPASLHARWHQLTGQQLLERYGMTEIGMALSHPYDGERRAGTVGVPLPGVEVRLVDDAGGVVSGTDASGEIQVRGPGVFLEYWDQPEATRDSFTEGWFRTGDVAVLERGQYRILGRRSVDIIKSGGYKLSALEIEAALLDHPAIRGCAVVGVPDDEWGEAVAVAAVLEPGETLDAQTLRGWCRERLSPYKIPRRVVVVDSLPQNALGKTSKPAVRALFTGGT